MMNLELNAYEMVIVLLASILIYFVLAGREQRWVRNAVFVLCILPALFLALEGGTELLTYDEVYMVPEITNLHTVTARQWDFGSYHSSIAITGNIVSLLNFVLSKDNTQSLMLAKSVHWFLGFTILVGIFYTVSCRWIPKKLFTAYFFVFFYSALLLPTNILSLKVANYDMLAMLLGIWGILCSLIGCEEVRQVAPALPIENLPGQNRLRSFLSELLWPDRGLTLLGLVLTTLAAQEKQIASPLFNLAIILSVLMRIRRRGAIDSWILIQFATCILAVSFLLATTYGLVALWRPVGLPGFDFVSAWRSLLIHFHIAISALGVSESNLLFEGGLLFLSLALAPMLWWSIKPADGRFHLLLQVAFPLLFIAAVIVGVIAFYKIDVFMAPSYPIPPGDFIPRGEEWNGETFHFLSPTGYEHFFKKTANAYSVFATSLPSAFCLVAIMAVVTILWKRTGRSQGSLLGFQTIALFSLAMPLLHVVTKTPVQVRYFDVWIFIDVLLLGILGCYLLESVRWQARAAIVIAFCLLQTIELAPFRPVVGAFWPCWADAARLRAAQVVEPGRMLPVWLGWGEEGMIAGRWLRHHAHSGDLPSRSFRLFMSEQGEWLQQDPAIATYVISAAPYLSFTENDYYVINRAAMMATRFDFLAHKKPIWTITYRGVPQAWLYRGSDLE